MTELKRFQIEARRWADSVFGELRPPHGAIAHLRLEVDELATKPFDIWEYADCLMLILDAAGNAGFDADELLVFAWEKLEINRARDWGKPDADGVVEHVRG